MIALQPIENSSQIAATGYDPTSQTLAVLFRSGQRYDYRGVPPEEADALRNADSPGRYLQSTIKPAYEFEKIDTEAASDSEGGTAD